MYGEYKADIEVGVGGDGYDNKPGLKINLSNANISPKEPHCSLHTDETIEIRAYPSGAVCKKCEQATRNTILQMLEWNNSKDGDNTDTTEPYIDCAAIKHTHECACHLGHDSASSGCASCDRINSLSALEQLAEASNDNIAMTSVHERLTSLESTNSLYKSALITLLSGGELDAGIKELLLR